METLLWIVTGGALGWASFSVLGFNEARGVALSVAIGAMGALIGAKAIAPLFVAAAVPAGSFSAPALFFAVAVAAVCLALANMLYRRWGV